MDREYVVTYKGNEYRYAAHTPYSDIAKDFSAEYDADIVLAVVNDKLQELFHTLEEDSVISFETTKGVSGHKAYKRSACLLLISAFYDVVGKENIDLFRVEFSIGAGYYCFVKGNFKLDDELIKKVREKMDDIVKRDVIIKKESRDLSTEMEKFRKEGREDKEKLFKYRRSSSINIYSLEGYEDYYYGYMVPSAGYIRYYDLVQHDEGLILQLPERKEPTTVPPVKKGKKLFRTMWTSNIWGEMIGIGTVGDLNEKISTGMMQQTILVQEALQESRIGDIAKWIKTRGNSRFVMIAGPSSSGKTTFSHRLSIELLAHGMKPHPIALDNYFKNREDTPIDEDGNYDFECLEAIDVEGFNKDMTKLLNGENVELPTFNFKSGRREYKGDFLQLGDEDVLVIEGIHGLNDKLSYSLPPESKYKIYISALTTLNVDDHNRVPTTDGRLIRRIVRDYRTRGASASKTLNMWASVRRGEEKYIFPFQESANAMFNSHLIYELAVLKPFVEPLLFGITKDDPAYQEAKRLLKFLEYFLAMDTASIPQNSIVREFIGGSCFNV
ncbi:MAG: nucleoside kinase [Lachnospiraceae bacterium]|nr:nucleoside kinase [Lachnospiraceae bacterium]